MHPRKFAIYKQEETSFSFTFFSILMSYQANLLFNNLDHEHFTSLAPLNSREVFYNTEPKKQVF